MRAWRGRRTGDSARLASRRPAQPRSGRLSRLLPVAVPALTPVLALAVALAAGWAPPLPLALAVGVGALALAGLLAAALALRATRSRAAGSSAGRSGIGVAALRAVEAPRASRTPAVDVLPGRPLRAEFFPPAPVDDAAPSSRVGPGGGPVTVLPAETSQPSAEAEPEQFARQVPQPQARPAEVLPRPVPTPAPPAAPTATPAPAPALAADPARAADPVPAAAPPPPATPPDAPLFPDVPAPHFGTARVRPAPEPDVAGAPIPIPESQERVALAADALSELSRLSGAFPSPDTAASSAEGVPTEGAEHAPGDRETVGEERSAHPPA